VTSNKVLCDGIRGQALTRQRGTDPPITDDAYLLAVGHELAETMRDQDDDSAVYSELAQKPK
jgi:hypothetical protein